MPYKKNRILFVDNIRTVFVSWSSLPYGSIVIEQIA